MILRVKDGKASIRISIRIRPRVPLSGVKGVFNRVIISEISVRAIVIAGKVTSPILATALTLGVPFTSFFAFFSAFSLKLLHLDQSLNYFRLDLCYW